MPVEIDALRDAFPVFGKVAYLNAGTDGPLPAAAARAGAAELQGEAERGRAGTHFERRHELAELLRGAYARALGCEPGDVALTTCTSEGLAGVIDGLGLRAGEEILTSDEEHPGLLGALAAARDLYGVSVRMAPFEEVAEAVGNKTRLVACSHVSWMTGRVAPRALAEVEATVLLDGAQGVGAVPVDVASLGCDAYAGAGQKWMCGPDGLGMLYVTPALRERLTVSRRGYGALLDPGAGLQARLHEDGRRFDAFALSAEALATALAAVETLEQSRMGGRARARDRPGREVCRGAPGRRTRSLPKGRKHACLLCQRRPCRGEVPPCRSGCRIARHPRPTPAEGLGGGLERRARPQAPARRPARLIFLAWNGRGSSTTVHKAAKRQGRQRIAVLNAPLARLCGLLVVTLAGLDGRLFRLR